MRSFKVLICSAALGLGPFYFGCATTTDDGNSDKKDVAGEEAGKDNAQAGEGEKAQTANAETSNAKASKEGDEGDGTEEMDELGTADTPSNKAGNEASTGTSGNNEATFGLGNNANDATHNNTAPSNVPPLPGNSAGANAATNGTNAGSGTSSTSAAVPNPPALPSGDTGSESRVVRFIKEDHTPVYDQASQSGQTVGTLSRGDAVVVTLQGEWALIAAGRYVAVASLSEKLVARTQEPNSWQSAAATPGK